MKTVSSITIVTLICQFAELVPALSINTDAARLKTDLFYQYDKNYSPRKDTSEKLKIKIAIYPRYLDFDLNSFEFTIECWMYLAWNDMHLQWLPEEYGQITKMQMPSNEIWLPDISIYNSVLMTGNENVIQDDLVCVVFNSGDVQCTQPRSFTSNCVPNISRYPFKTQNCSLHFGPMSRYAQETEVVLLTNSTSLADFTSGLKFDLIDAYSTKHLVNFKVTYVKFEFIFKIISSIDLYFVPLFVLISLNITALMIQANSSDRLYVCICNVFLHLLYSTLIFGLPTDHQEASGLYRFTRDSMVLVGFIILLTIILRSLEVFAVPLWIKKILNVITGNKYCGFILLFKCNTFEQLKTNVDSKHLWAIFAKCIDTLCLYVYVIVYLYMFVCLIF